MKENKTLLKKGWVRFLLFWVLFFLGTATTSSWFYSSNEEVLVTYTIRIIYQCIIASVITFVLIPKFLNKGKKGWFALFSAILLIVSFIVCTLTKMYYLEPNYPITYQNYLSKLSDTSLYGRLFNIAEFLKVSNYLLQPTFLLLAIRFYRKQQALVKLNEQKTVAELTALKNQLNPHFLFNTLNNLYALAYKKSDKIMLVIQKLSGILDYMLYGCNDKFVPIHKEVELIESYLTLEKIRYDDRVEISFDKDIKGEIKIAPLLLLTFVENAFKHGVSQALSKAEINIHLLEQKTQIEFTIKNTKSISKKENDKEEIGLKNVKKQLSLLYPNNYELIIDENEKWYTVHLKINTI